MAEYEYTSQAMELGIKYYILKPCDEERMLPVIEKVKEEIQEKQQQKRKYDTTVKKLLPLAKEQVSEISCSTERPPERNTSFFSGRWEIAGRAFVFSDSAIPRQGLMPWSSS